MHNRHYYLLDGIDHVESHFYGVFGVVGRGLWQTRHAVVTIAENLDSQAIVVGRELIETAEKFVEQSHQLLSRALRRQHGEAHDVREQDAVKIFQSVGHRPFF